MGTLLHPSKHTKTVNGPWVRASVGKQSGWESSWLPPVITTGKRPRLPPCFAQITGPLLDTGPKQRRPCLLLITLHSLSVCEFWFLLSSANRYLSVSVRLSIHPSILSLPCAAYITLRTQDWLIRETLYKGNSQRGIWLDKTLEIKTLSGKLYPDIWSCIFIPNRSLCFFVSSTSRRGILHPGAQWTPR